MPPKVGRRFQFSRGLKTEKGEEGREKGKSVSPFKRTRGCPFPLLLFREGRREKGEEKKHLSVQREQGFPLLPSLLTLLGLFPFPLLP
jgi:hypothetical protein